MPETSPETSVGEPQIITEYETMMYKRRGKTAYIMLNRPQALNAVNDQFEEDLHSALLEFDLDDQAWVAIIHGAGRGFCAGADIKQRLVTMTPEQSARRERGPNPEGYMGRAINWKPVIAAVHGYALGAGIVIAAESDMIVASEDAKFGITETRRGLPAGRIWAKVSAFMPSKIASEMAITGEHIDAAELYRLGFVNRLVPTGEHISAAEELAEKVLKSPPLATRAAVKLTRRQWVQTGADADMQMLPLKLHLTEDFKEASQSFVEKRAPEYHAR
ncbi:MAG: enoyl-CoA hydratase [Chloroflexi bacterium]|jgi:enoyl-CoA hydratase/carnithine racemase|nr:enoyl-CoA hydratase [Chloroflexota bacterium]MDP6497030.1 enoyl-CoA hydratase-related protein [Dehalococcoidia bacterium]MQG54351.1 enoyl-CoA hydratase/isomerase family protein [SAR202 cluster bacterium]|tara:strand:- start:94366 stop:95190 length:825 start_codon:yes stop_codon:yes gene_type:complete